MITDNGKQFIYKKYEAFFQGLGIKHVMSSVEHPQTIVVELKRRLSDRKGAWVDERLEILWAYQCTLHDMTGETPFNLTCGTNAMLPVELGESSLR